MHLLIECLKRYHHTCYTNIITGDLNLPKIDWFKLTCNGDLLHKPFLDFVIDYGYTQVVEFPTRGPNILDVVLVDNVQAVFNISHRPPFSSSDHVVVLFSLLFGNDCADSSLKTIRYCWCDANFDDMIGFLGSINWLHVISSFPSV